MIRLLGMKYYVLPPPPPRLTIDSISDTVFSDGGAVDNTLFAIAYDGFWVASAVTATYIAMKMMPKCTFTVHADCGVRIIPLIGGILKTPFLLCFHVPILTI